MARVTFLFLLTLLVPSTKLDPMCDVANVQVENEDGTFQVFEVKRLEPVVGETCVFCSQKPVNSVPRPTQLRTNVFISAGEVSTKCEFQVEELPIGLCSSLRDQGHCTKDEQSCEHDPEDLAEDIVKQGLLPLASGDYEKDKAVAVGFVLLNMGSLDEAMSRFTKLLKIYPDNNAAFYGRGIVYQRRGLQEIANAAKSVREFTEAIMQSKKFHEPYERRAESYIALHHYDEALDDLNKAAETSPSKRLYFIRGIVNLLLENFADAERDFKKTLDSESSLYLPSYFHLGIALYYRGKIRNAIEVFKEVLQNKPDHVDASTSLAQAFRELGNIKAASRRFNQSVHMNPRHAQTLQLWGSLLYTLGDFGNALLKFDRCLLIDSKNINCQYMKALSLIAGGRIFNGLKSATKVMVHNTPAIKASPDFMKAHYLREYARYLHSHLDDPFLQFNPDEDLDGDFKNRWSRELSFDFKDSYKEQPGLQPEISDVAFVHIVQYSKNIQGLLCKAHKIGLSMQVISDGFIQSRRHNLAMGLASLHIAQLLDRRWREMRVHKQVKSLDWRDIYNIAVQYRRLVDPGQAVFWLDKMPDHSTRDGYRTDFSFIKGPTQNIKVMQYYDLVFKLLKTMLEHYSGEGTIFYPELQDDIEKAKTCEDLLVIAKKRNINQNGFMVSTQVPSSHKSKENDRLEGSMITLTKDIDKNLIFSINIANTKSRTKQYHAEIDMVFNQLQEEIKRTGVHKLLSTDSVLDKVLTMAYYFYNMMPLTRGTSAVAYSVVVGLVMSVHRVVNGKIPAGKLLEMEAILSGAPDAFILVTKNWMNVKTAEIPITIHPKIYEVFPTVRSVLEVLNANTDLCVYPSKP
ncbi:hypothetical protein FSP39_014746 [Pinctada imbricata]|uniref:Tetratricopeptide repeat protein 13 n=1 Tax=Pinctada imbricata TaxID=66713 RepID=A0AA88XVR3_PINIB|nr:hypothetical protein FSP39_014746 [Pinctada imbricata]